MRRSVSLDACSPPIITLGNPSGSPAAIELLRKSLRVVCFILLVKSV
jgi:hypothetical protein